MLLEYTVACLDGNLIESWNGRGEKADWSGDVMHVTQHYGNVNELLPTENLFGRTLFMITAVSFAFSNFRIERGRDIAPFASLQGFADMPTPK